jgi:hypothetical protein
LRDFRGPRKTAPSTKRDCGVGTFRPVNACANDVID